MPCSFSLAHLSVVLDYEMSALAFGKLPDLATRHAQSVYDAAHLELALRTKLAIACKDGRCARRPSVRA